MEVQFSVREEEFVVGGEGGTHDLVHSDLGLLDLFLDLGLVLLLDDLLLFLRFPRALFIVVFLVFPIFLASFCLLFFIHQHLHLLKLYPRDYLALLLQFLIE